MTSPHKASKTRSDTRPGPDLPHRPPAFAVLILRATAVCALAACVPAAAPAPVGTVALDRVAPTEAMRRSVDPPPEEDAGICWARDDAPADAARGPAPGGAAASWFRFPCAAETEAPFIASVQRALAARDLYGGEITGENGPTTRTAIIAYQRTLGLRSGILSLAAARTLGLVPWQPGASLWE